MPEAVQILLTGDGEEAIVMRGKQVLVRDLEGNERPAEGIGADEENFDPDLFARAGGKWGKYRVVGPDGSLYPTFAGPGLPPMTFTNRADGEPVFQVQRSG